MIAWHIVVDSRAYFVICNRCLKHIDEPAGKAAVIWMVGEYGDEITVRLRLLDKEW